MRGWTGTVVSTLCLGTMTFGAETDRYAGARTVEQLEDNLTAAGLTLSAQHSALLDEVSTPATGDYPYGTAGVEQRCRALPS